MYINNTQQLIISQQKKRQYDELGFYLSNAIMKMSTALVKKLLSFLPAKLVVLTGTSCSSKSTVAKYLAQSDPHVIHIDADKIIRQGCLQLIKDNDPRAFAELYNKLGEDLAYYVIYYSPQELFSHKNIISSQINVPALQKFQQLLLQDQSARATLNKIITHKLLGIIKANLLLGKIVILDIVTDKAGLKPFIEMLPLTVSIYQPLKQLASYISSRNQSAIEQNLPLSYRSPDFIYSQLNTFFTKQVSVAPTLELISIKHLQQFVAATLNNGKEWDNIHNTDVQEFTKSISEKLKLSEQQLSAICLKEPYNLVINAKNLEAKQLAEMIYRYLQHRSLYQKTHKNSPCKAINQLNATPRLIILDGLSTAGKTTTAEAFMQLNPASILLLRSERQRKLLTENMPTVLKYNNHHGTNIFCYASYRNHHGFKRQFSVLRSIDSAYLDQIAGFAQTKQAEILLTEEKKAAEKARKYLSAGITVLLDNLIYKDDLSHFAGLAPVVVLVYCPFARILHQLKLRDDEAIQDNKPLKWRDPYKICMAYTHLFGPINKLDCAENLEILKKNAVLDVLEKLFTDFPPEEFGITKETFIDTILERLGLHDAESIEVYPQLTRPDLVLNTQYNVNDNAAELAAFIIPSASSMLMLSQ